MLIFLILSFFFGIMFFLSRFHNIRASILASIVINGCYLLGASEILGLTNMFCSQSILATWILATIIWSILVLRHNAAITAKNAVIKARDAWYRTGSFEKLLVFFILILSVITFIIAIFGLPNNWDSLTYHLPRVFFWLQHRNLAHFPTNDYRLLYTPPFAEYVCAHMWVLSGNIDSVMNLVGWSSYLCLFLSVSLVAMALGVSMRGQLMSALVVGTMPHIIMQGSTTQNDLVTAMLLTTALAFWLLSAERKFKIYWTLGIAAAGLALATKLTAFIYLPFVAFIPVIRVIKTKRLTAIVCLCIALLPSTGWMYRNVSFFCAPFGYHDDTCAEEKRNAVQNGFFSPRQIIASTIRNSSLLFSTPFAGPNRVLTRVTRLAQEYVKINPDDPRLTWCAMPFKIPLSGPHEDSAPALWHFVLVIMILAMIIRTALRAFRKRPCPLGSVVQTLSSSPSKEKRAADHTISLSLSQGERAGVRGCLLALSLVCGFLAMCVYARWTPWNARFLVVWLVLLFAVTAQTLQNLPHRIGNSLCVVAFILALPFALFATNRSIVPFEITIGDKRIRFVSVFEKDNFLRYSAAHPEDAEELEAAVHAIKELRPKTIGIKVTEADPAIFPLLVLTKKGVPETYFQYTSVSNRSAILREHTQLEDIIVIVGPPLKKELKGYRLELKNDSFSIWQRTRAAPVSEL